MAIEFADITGEGPTALPGVTERIARSVLVTARTITPCLDSLDDQRRLDAIAILQSIALEVAARGPRHVQSQRIGSAAVTYGDLGSFFSSDDRAALRSLCASSDPAGLPIGSFPVDSVTGRLWPERYS